MVRGYRLPSAGYLFLRIDDPARARALLAEITPDVLTAAPWERKPESGINLAVTYAGLEALGVPGTSLAGFPDDFRSGMAARAELLGDVGESAPEHWEAPFGRGEIHVLVMISAQDPAALAARDARLREAIERHGGITVVGGQAGSALPGGTEHFGFADGFAQPAIEGSGVDPLPGQGAPLKDGGWRPIRAGEFILGYRDEEDAIPRAPVPDQLAANGSYLVYRKLRQDVTGFRRTLADAARHYPGGEEQLAAKLVGRWRDGTPLDLSPDRPDPAIVADAGAQQRVLLPRRPGRAALPCRQPHPPRQPAPRPAVRGQARQPPPPDPARDPLRRAAAGGRRGRRRRTAASSSCACRRASRASSSSCRRSGSTTATACASATTRTS